VDWYLYWSGKYTHLWNIESWTYRTGCKGLLPHFLTEILAEIFAVTTRSGLRYQIVFSTSHLNSRMSPLQRHRGRRALVMDRCMCSKGCIASEELVKTSQWLRLSESISHYILQRTRKRHPRAGEKCLLRVLSANVIDSARPFASRVMGCSIDFLHRVHAPYLESFELDLPACFRLATENDGCSW